MGPSRRYTNQEFADAVAVSRSMRQALCLLGVSPHGGNYETARRRIIELRLDTSHFVSQGWRRGSNKPVLPAIPLDQLLVEGRLTQTVKLKQGLIDAGFLKAGCEMCRGRRWNGSAIPLELDHVNGRRDDNRLCNLRLLCPNCHAQTPTYRGRNIGRR
jgi:hypothetical protein